MGLFFYAAPFSLAQEAEDTRNLSDLKAEISFLSGQIENLRSELQRSTAPLSATNQGEPIERLNLIEGELRRLTGRIELLEFEVKTNVKDAEQRIGTLSDRLTVLEGGELVDAPSAGNNLDVSSATLTVAERDDFALANAALDDEDYVRAADLFMAYTAEHQSSPLRANAFLNAGTAYQQIDDHKRAGQAFLEGFTIQPKGTVAPKALLGLGTSLKALDKVTQACRTLTELSLRFPDAPEVSDAKALMDEITCQ